MLYDLNIAWSPSTSAAELTRTLKFSASLGYNVVALNHTLTLPIPGSITNPLPKLTSASGSSNNNNNNNNNNNSAGQAKSQHDDLPTVLTRCTVSHADSSVGHHLPRLVNHYDIVALRPTNDKAFQAACLSLDNAHIISLDLTQFLDYHFKPTQVMAAVNRGMRFEICYSQVLGGADARARASFIGNVMSLVRATKGRGFVISSEARNVMGLRGPADVINLLAVWSLSSERGKEGLGVNPRGVVVNEGIKRKGFRGVVEIVQVAKKQPQEAGPDKMEGLKQSGGDTAEQNKKKDTAEAGKGGSKRKGAGPQGPGDGQMSKRQAKKLKKLAEGISSEQ